MAHHSKRYKHICQCIWLCDSVWFIQASYFYGIVYWPARLVIHRKLQSFVSLDGYGFVVFFIKLQACNYPNWQSYSFLCTTHNKPCYTIEMWPPPLQPSKTNFLLLPGGHSLWFLYNKSTSPQLSKLAKFYSVLYILSHGSKYYIIEIWLPPPPLQPSKQTFAITR